MQAKIDSLFERYMVLFDNLHCVVKVSERRVIDEDPDDLFVGNVNFFVKSYMINVCTYLEAYLQDLAFLYASEINRRIIEAKVPHNYIVWGVSSKEVKDKDLKFEDANYSLTKKNISDEISPNPYRTIKLFKKLGINLAEDSDFNIHREKVEALVVKRNNIIHHNDNAIDVSFSDIISGIQMVKEGGCRL